MTSGETRGLLDMTISLDYSIAQSVILLDKTPKYDGEDGEDTAIVTESSAYDYAKTEYIQNYKQPRIPNPLSKEQNTEHIILNETQSIIDSSTLSSEVYELQLTPESWLSSTSNTVDFNDAVSKSYRLRVVYEFEKIDFDNANAVTIENATQKILLPLNDILDVCVKSQFKKSRKNFNVPGNLIYSGYSQKANGNIDIYIDFDDYPIDFCQCNNTAFLLTQPSTKQPYMLQSTLPNDLFYSQQHAFQLEQRPLYTFLYKEPSKYDSTASSYAQISNAIADLGAEPESSLSIFDPTTKLEGIQYNYIIGIDQMKSNVDQNNSTIYGNGDIYGSIALAKNMYNSTYSMEMPTNLALHRCRSYCGIQNTQDRILLKYYDNTYYSFNRNEKDSDNVVKTERHIHNISKDGTILYPYQKVEYFQPNKMASYTKHKSNLFSIKIYDSGLDDSTVNDAKAVDKNIAEQVKRDIFNGIRALTESIAPANTQLFKTYYLTTS